VELWFSHGFFVFELQNSLKQISGSKYKRKGKGRSKSKSKIV